MAPSVTKEIWTECSFKGVVDTICQGVLIGAVTTMPTQALVEGIVVLYVGETDEIYTNGQFYRYGADSTWSEIEINVGSSTLTPGMVLVSDGDGGVTTSDITVAELANLAGSESPLQGQIDAVRESVDDIGITSENNDLTVNGKTASAINSITYIPGFTGTVAPNRLLDVKGGNLFINGVKASQTLDGATVLPVGTDEIGGVKNGGNVTINSDGTMDVDTSEFASKSDVTALQSTVAGKQDAITGGASSIASANLVVSRALISDENGKVAVSPVTSTELGYLDGVASGVQGQLDALRSQITAMGGFAVQVVDSLPGTGQSNTIYFIPAEGGSGQNIKDEYMWINDAWELIGSTEFSLSIVQSDSGISINGTSLQTATTSRAGLMTPAEVQTIDALNTNLGTAEDNITALQSQMSTANGNITALQSQMAQKANTADLADVATSGSYNDLSNKPTIPTVPGVATTSSNGLMSASDKTKLNGIATGANNYTLPVGGTAIGGVKNGGNVTIDSSGNMSVSLSGYATTSQLNAKADTSTVNALTTRVSTAEGDIDDLESEMSTMASRVSDLEGQESYVLPVATSSRLGGVKATSSIIVEDDGSMYPQFGMPDGVGIQISNDGAYLETTFTVYMYRTSGSNLGYIPTTFAYRNVLSLQDLADALYPFLDSQHTGGTN